ncbi:hypothetical protein [Botrimarina hoheduenensis]|uniref:hypothetical protein n=1 Tax=Botrimarina hoheduenensis TaxID=2528000 RepID=UPI0011B5D365|nr:hypothetical protein [Botrimarina hoheduenensis]
MLAIGRLKPIGRDKVSANRLGLAFVAVLNVATPMTATAGKNGTPRHRGTPLGDSGVGYAGMLRTEAVQRKPAK